jgi:hypothetical protein
LRISKVIAQAIAVAAPSFVLSAQAASECPATGTLSDWGVNSTGYFSVALPVSDPDGGDCIKFEHFTHTCTRDIEKAQRFYLPIHCEGWIERPDTFAVKATGKGPTASGTSVVTMNATLQ